MDPRPWRRLTRIVTHLVQPVGREPVTRPPDRAARQSPTRLRWRSLPATPAEPPNIGRDRSGRHPDHDGRAHHSRLHRQRLRSLPAAFRDRTRRGRRADPAHSDSAVARQTGRRSDGSALSEPARGRRRSATHVYSWRQTRVPTPQRPPTAPRCRSFRPPGACPLHRDKSLRRRTCRAGR